MNTQLQEMFEKLSQYTQSDDLQAQQAQLDALLLQIKDEMQSLIQDTHFGRDQYYQQQFEKIADSRKRLDQVNNKMGKIQQRVDAIERRLVKLQ